MRHQYLTTLAIAASLAMLAACSPGRINTAPDGNIVPRLAGNGGSSNPLLTWLPPTADNSGPFTGEFDGSHDFTLRVVCVEAAGPGCPNVRFSIAASGYRVTVAAQEQEYRSNLNAPAALEVGPGKYELQVLEGSAIFATAPLWVVEGAGQLGTVGSGHVGLVRGQQFPVRFRVDRPSPATSVRINEVESDNGVPGDWVELHNSAAVAIDLGGYRLKDNMDRPFAIPAGTIIPAGGFLVLEESAFDFGLGAADMVRLFAPDNVTLIDSYQWSSHAAGTTYGRCPDGSGEFVLTTVSTKGSANDCSPRVVINEIESNNGVPGDWVELYNPGPTPANLSGYIFRDNSNSSYVIPAGTIIPVGGYLVLDESAFGFGLGASDQARLFAPNGTTLVDSYTWTSHAATTYGRCADGVGQFTTTVNPTKGAANACPALAATVVINEVESNGGVPGDWIELYNTGSEPVDLSGFIIRDDNDNRIDALPAGTVIAAGGYLVLDENVHFSFGLGAADMARLFAPDGVTLVASYSWTSHAGTTYGRCPDGSGEFATTTVGTRGGPNACGVAVVINEVESNGGVPGDWIELYNRGPVAVSLAGYVLRDNGNGSGYTLPAGTSIPGGGYLVIDESAFGFGLGASDQARLFAPGGVTLIDSYTWTSHAATTYARCPDGTGDFATATAPTKGSANSCPGQVTVTAWPGEAAVTTVDLPGAFPSNLSGLVYQPSGTSAPGILWAARNGPGALFRLTWTGTNWIPDTGNDWGTGKLLRYPGGTGDVDAEGVTFAATPEAGVYVASERNNSASGTSRNSILRYDVTAAGTALTATHEWNLTAALPATGANLGLEAVAWVPDSYLTARGFIDESKGGLYSPADYPDHGSGLFAVGLEAIGDSVYFFALDHTSGSFTRIATIPVRTSFAGVMDLAFDRELGRLWVVCDDGCQGRTAVLEIDTGSGSPTQGRFIVTGVFERPSGVANLNNEGFAITSQGRCSNGSKPVYWADDGATGGHAIRQGMVSC